MSLDFVVVDLRTLPKLPPRMVWTRVAKSLCIHAIKTRWDGDREVVYLCNPNGTAKYWRLLNAGDGEWVSSATVETVEEAVALLHAWCLVGLADFTLKED